MSLRSLLVALAVVLMYRTEFSLSALISWLSPAISVGCGLKISSISSFMPSSEFPSPSVSMLESPSVRQSISLLLSDSSERSEVKTEVARLGLLLLLTFEGTGEGVLRTDGGFEFCCLSSRESVPLLCEAELELAWFEFCWSLSVPRL